MAIIILHCSSFDQTSVRLSKNYIARRILQEVVTLYPETLAFFSRFSPKNISQLKNIFHTITMQENILRPLVKWKTKVESATYIATFTNEQIKNGIIHLKIYSLKDILPRRNKVKLRQPPSFLPWQSPYGYCSSQTFSILTSTFYLSFPW